jgi:hypothetical protein
VLPGVDTGPRIPALLIRKSMRSKRFRNPPWRQR